MIKALFKKQMMEVFSWLYRDKRSGKNRGAKGTIGYAVLYLMIFGLLGYTFWGMADLLCAPLVAAGLGWLYMAMMSLVGIALGVLGSVFNTFSSLYQAKDNDLLLSMPISASKVLLIRLSGVYSIGLMYELIVMIPVLIVFFTNVKLRFAGYVFSVLMPLILSVFVLTLSCILGFFVALVSAKLKNKNMITVILSLAFIAGYYYVYAKAYSALQSILANPAALGDTVKSVLYPFYHMGLGCEGNVVSMVIFTGIIAVLFVAVYLVMSRSFLSITTTNKGSTRVKYRQKRMKMGKIKSALLKKEFRRFLGSSAYMLNCGLGVVMMLAAAVALLLKGNGIAQVLYGVFQQEEKVIPLLAVAAVCMLTSMNDITAPSVSLEGKNLWILQSIPVKAVDALMAKCKLHLYLTVIPALVLTACALWCLQPVWYFTVLLPITVTVFVVLMALAGLYLNLKIPNFHWTNETVLVKQSMSVMFSLFGGWGIVLAFGGIYLALAEYIEPFWYLIGVTFLMFVISGVLLHWIRTKGAKIFETL